MMRLHVVYDRSGRILAAAQVGRATPERNAEGAYLHATDRYRSAVDADEPVPLPEAGRGQYAAQVTLPADASDLGAEGVFSRFVVKGKGERATLAARSAPRSSRKAKRAKGADVPRQRGKKRRG
jgi:hypothetical protein